MASKSLLGPLLGRLRLGLDLVETRQTREHFCGDLQAVDVGLEFIKAPLTLFQGAIVVTLLGESRLGLLTAVLEHRVNVSTEQRADVDLHRLSPHVILVDFVSVDRTGFVLRKQNRDFRTHARTCRAIGFAIGLILYGDLVGLIDPIHIEQTKTQTLHAVGASIVIDHRKPGLPMRSCFGHPVGYRVDVLGKTLQTLVPHVPGVDFQVPLGRLEVRRTRKAAQDDQLVMS